MASRCIRSFTRSSLSLSRAAAAAAAAAAAPRSSASSFVKGSTAASPSIRRRFASISRLPVELGCLGGGSMYPLHSAVAAARLTSRLSTASRSCRDLSQGTLCRTYPGL